VRVLVLSHLYPAPGHERHLFVHQQVLGLRAAGVDVSVFSPTGYSPRLPLLSGARLRRRRATPARAVRDGVAIDYPRVLVLPRRLLYDRSGDIFHATLARRVPALRAAGVELIHAHQALPDGAAAARLARDLDVPYVVTVHGVDVYRHLRDGGRVADRTIEIVGGAAAVVGVSSSVTRRLAPYVAPERLFVNHNGTLGASDARETAPVTDEATGDAARTDDLTEAGGAGAVRSAGGLLAAAGVGPDEPVVLTAGYLIERKGHRVMLDALARIVADRGAEACPHWVVAGDGPLRGALLERAAQLGLAARVHLLGRLPHDDVLALMERAVVFALPSWDEAFGLVYTEAMMAGTPVIACRGEGPEDFVVDGLTGYLVPAHDAAALATVIEGVLDDPAAARAAGTAGRKTAAALTWQRNADRQKRIYEWVLGRGPAPDREDRDDGRDRTDGRGGTGHDTRTGDHGRHDDPGRTDERTQA